MSLEFKCFIKKVKQTNYRSPLRDEIAVLQTMRILWKTLNN